MPFSVEVLIGQTMQDSSIRKDRLGNFIDRTIIDTKLLNIFPLTRLI